LLLTLVYMNGVCDGYNGDAMQCMLVLFVFTDIVQATFVGSTATPSVYAPSAESAILHFQMG
jgi:hypothetical protein